MTGTIIGVRVSDKLISNFFDTLVNCFFKILPIRESEEESLPVYMRSLQSELVGCGEFIEHLNNDARFLRLISTLQYLIDHPDCDVHTVKREVFKSIRICEQMSRQYGEADTQ